MGYSAAIAPLSPLFCHERKGSKGRIEERQRRGNDFEIFVAVHKFEGGGYAYLNTDRTFFPSSSQFFLMVVFFLFVLFISFAAVRGSCCRSAGSYLISFLLPRFSSSASSSSFRVPTSIVSRALINYPKGHPVQIPLSLLLFLLARTGNERDQIHSLSSVRGIARKF